MGRDTTKAAGNVWYEARMRAAQYNDALRSQDSTAAMAGVGRDAIIRIEHGANKVMPVDTAVVLSEIYNAPELLNYYCLNECPIGKNRPLSDKVHGIDRVTVKLLHELRIDDLSEVQDKLLRIAADGDVSDDEVEDLKSINEFFKGVSKTLSELETLTERIINGGSPK